MNNGRGLILTSMGVVVHKLFRRHKLPEAIQIHLNLFFFVFLEGKHLQRNWQCPYKYLEVVLVSIVMSGSSDDSRTPRPAIWLVGWSRRCCCTMATFVIVMTVVVNWRASSSRNAEEPLADDILATTVLRHRTATNRIATQRNWTSEMEFFLFWVDSFNLHTTFTSFKVDNNKTKMSVNFFFSFLHEIHLHRERVRFRRTTTLGRSADYSGVGRRREET